jgi:hypothetical protein
MPVRGSASRSRPHDPAAAAHRPSAKISRRARFQINNASAMFDRIAVDSGSFCSTGWPRIYSLLLVEFGFGETFGAMGFGQEMRQPLGNCDPSVFFGLGVKLQNITTL